MTPFTQRDVAQTPTACMRLHSIHCLVFDCLASGLKLLGVVVFTWLLELGFGHSQDSWPTPTSLQVAFSLHLFELGAALNFTSHRPTSH
jgi:hypothetical protein